MSLFQVDQDNSTLGAIQQNLDRFRTLKLKSKMEIMTFLNDASFLVQETIHILRKHIFRIFEPPSPLRKLVFSTESKQKLELSDPLSPLQGLT